MTIKPFRRIRTDREDIKQLQDATAETFKTVVSREVLDGQLISGLSLVSGSLQRVEHKLGRAPRGYIVTSRSANSVVWDSESTLPSKYLELNVSANVTLSLWVF